jgi:hypothetical protein
MAARRESLDDATARADVQCIVFAIGLRPSVFLNFAGGLPIMSEVVHGNSAVFPPCVSIW